MPKGVGYTEGSNRFRSTLVSRLKSGEKWSDIAKKSGVKSRVHLMDDAAIRKLHASAGVAVPKMNRASVKSPAKPSGASKAADMGHDAAVMKDKDRQSDIPEVSVRRLRN